MEEQLSEHEAKQLLNDAHIEVTDDPRSYVEIVRFLSLIPIPEVQIAHPEPESKV